MKEWIDIQVNTKLICNVGFIMPNHVLKSYINIPSPRSDPLAVPALIVFRYGPALGSFYNKFRQWFMIDLQIVPISYHVLVYFSKTLVLCVDYLQKR